MLRVCERIVEVVPAQARLSLPFALRQRSRLRAQLDDGREVGLFLPRGAVLRHGDLLRSECGLVIVVQAAVETVSTARAPAPLLFARACYHLGNRHVPLQMAQQWLRYERDHVLDDMLRQLGLDVVWEDAPFEPEAGAYGEHGGHHHGVIAGRLS
jgi:urease accessory protein